MKKYPKEVQALIDAIIDSRTELATTGMLTKETDDKVAKALDPFLPVPEENYRLPNWDKVARWLNPDLKEIDDDGAFKGEDGDRYIIERHFWEALRYATRKVK